jgi:hypothetical protein
MPRSGGRSSSRGRSYGGFGGGSRGFGSGAYRYTPRSGSSSQTRTSGAYTQPPISNTTQTRTSPFGSGGFGSTIAHGMAFGGGSAIAHHAIGSMMGGGPYARQGQAYSDPNIENWNNKDSSPIQNSQNGEDNQKTNPCFDYSMKFVDCLKGVDDISKCQSLFDELKSCERNLKLT